MRGMNFLHVILLFVLGFTGSVLSSSVGGGGFLVSSGLVLLGFPPQIAVGTGRFGGIGSTVMAIVTFSSRKKIDIGLGLVLALFSSVGALIGMYALRRVPDDAWIWLASANLILALVVILSNPQLGVEVDDGSISPLRRLVGYFLYPIVGVWVGFFGGGGAIIANLILLVFFGQSFLESAGTRKIPALFVAVGTFVVSAMQGDVDWLSGAVLFAGMTLGSYVGARIAIALGDMWMRRFVITFVLCSLLGLSWSIINN